MAYKLRTAETADASAICDVLRNSIRSLCFEDHNGDEKVISVWLENKTIENMEKWISSADSTTVVCEQKGVLYGVGSIGTDGTIHLCYVAPEKANTGIGKQLLYEMLRIAKSYKTKTVNLISTKSAKCFYEKYGFIRSGGTVSCFGIEGYPMHLEINVSSEKASQPTPKNGAAEL